MQLIEQEATVLGECPSDIEEAILWIEKAGRVCYKSEDRIIEGSGKKFVNGIIKRGHFSVIEHSNMVIRSPEQPTFPNKYLDKVNSFYTSKFLHSLIHNGYIYTGGNFRAWMEKLKLFSIDDLNTFHGNLIVDQKDIPNALKLISVEFITDRAITHELVRHRPASYCLAGDTMVHHFANEQNNSTGKKRSIKTLYEYTQDSRKSRIPMIRLTGMDEEGELIPVAIKSIVKSGAKKVYEVVTSSGRKIKASKKHKFFTADGCVRLQELSIGDSILCNGSEVSREYIKQRYLIDNMQRKDLAKEIGISNAWLGKKIALWGLQKPKKQYPNRQGGYGKPGMHSEEEKKRISKQMTGENNPSWNGGIWKNGNSKCTSMYDIKGQLCVCGAQAQERHHTDRNPHNNEPDNIEFVCRSCHKARHFDRVKIVFEDKITSITYMGKEETYDIEVDHPCHNFVANGLIVHNSQESQRYVQYNDVLFIKPYWYDKEPVTVQMSFEISCSGAEKYYTWFRKNADMKAEQARAVLPNCTATKIVMTASIPEWCHVFKLRCSKAAYPGIRELMEPVRDKFIDNGWIV